MDHLPSFLNVPYRLPGDGAGYRFELTGGSGAALVTRHETHPEDTGMDTAFEAYTKRHYQSWVGFARRRLDGNDIHPVLITGFDMTTDFSVVVYPNEDGVHSPNSAEPIRMFAHPHSFLGEWWTRCSVHKNEGSQQPGDTNQPNQCVFIRYYTMRWRFLLHKVPKVPFVSPASARPHNFDSGENRGGTFLEFPAQSDPEYTESNDPEHTESDDRDPGRQHGSVTDGADSGSKIDVRNPPYVWFLLSLSFSALNFASRRSMIPGMPSQITYSR